MSTVSAQGANDSAQGANVSAQGPEIDYKRIVAKQQAADIESEKADTMITALEDQNEILMKALLKKDGPWEAEAKILATVIPFLVAALMLVSLYLLDTLFPEYFSWTPISKLIFITAVLELILGHFAFRHTWRNARTWTIVSLAVVLGAAVWWHMTSNTNAVIIMEYLNDFEVYRIGS